VKPRGKNAGALSLAGTAIWILPVPWAFSLAPSATLAWLWYPLCGRRPLNANTDTLAVAARCVRLRSRKSVTVHIRSVGDSYVI
jgi:hypothetical protein